MLPGRHRIPHRQALRSKEEGLSCCVAPSNTLPDPDHPDRTPCPPKSSVKRTGLAVASGRTLQTPAPAGDPCSGEGPLRALQVRNRPAAGATMGKTSLGNIREVPQRACSARAGDRCSDTTGA